MLLETWEILIIICSLIAGLLFGLVLDAAITSEYEIAELYCTENGYQGYEESNDVFFCITYGLEPKIYRLGTQSELKGE